MAKAGSMRGLQVFISDIRASQNKEQEQKRVEKELAKIRGKFGDDRALTSYDRKKYVWKLLYIYMLGYDIEFGHKQACDLIPASKYSEKQVGYMACSLLLNENDDFLRLAINAIHMDLVSRNEAFQCLGLSFVANVGGQEMAEALTQDVLKILTSGNSRPVVRKKAVLTLLRLIRKTPVDAQLVSADTFSPVIANMLEEHDVGVLTSTVGLLLGISTRLGSAGYETCQHRVIKILERLVFNKDKDISVDYTYYRIPSPWLQSKCLRVLQYFPPPENPAQQKMLHDIIQTVITNCGEGTKTMNVNESNAKHAILFEAVALCLHLDSDRELLSNSVATLGRFLTVKEPNIKYLALENIARLALVPEILETIRHHQSTIITSLKDPDVSIRKRALDLLFTMCDTSSAKDIVQELVKYLTVADFSMREELVLKVAVLAEKFAPDVKWYVDVALELLERAGDFVSDDIWHRVVQLVTNNESMQEYAARNIVDVLRRGAAHESLLCVAAYVLGEFGHLISAKVPIMEQYKLLQDRFPASSTSTKGLLLTAFIKLYLHSSNNPQLKAEVMSVFQRYGMYMDAELQQRAVEYMAMAERPGLAQQHYFLPMPKWEERESTLLRRLQANEGADDGAAPASMPTDQPGSPSKMSSISSALTSTGASAGPAPPASPPPVQVAPASKSVDLLGDDLLGDDFGGAPSSSIPPAATPAADPLADLMGGPSHPDPFGAPTSPVSPGTIASVEPIQVVGDLGAYYQNLLTGDRGVLYQDTCLQLGLSITFQRAVGQLTLFLGNRNQAVPITNLRVQIPATPAVQAAMGTIPASIPPGQQAQVPLQLSIAAPFSDPPHLQLAYTCGNQSMSQDLKLPVLPNRSMIPYPSIPQANFFDTWKQLAGPPSRQQEMVERTSPASPDAVLSLIRALSFGAEHGYLDPSPHNEAGAAHFVCGTPEQSVLVQVRVEANPQNRTQFRVTVVSPAPQLATAMKDTLVANLKSLP